MEPAIIATWKFGAQAADAGMKVLRARGSALDAVEEAIRQVEGDMGNRTVGLGGYPNMEGHVELDALIMDGLTLRAGAVAAVRDVKHPISLARKVMEETPHVMIVGEGACKLARFFGLELRSELHPDSERAWRERLGEALAQEPDKGTLEFWAKLLAEQKSHDTIGVVAMDYMGNIAVGVSTSGLAFKFPGRVGDSPIVGSGAYADNLAGGACASGLGENIMRHCVSKMVVERMRCASDAQSAVEEVIRAIIEREPSARHIHVIALDRQGRPGASTTEERFEHVYMNASMTEPELRVARNPE
jgi:N4-(beta-N-acetylglucosaminyl)-L-asparaginase